MVLGCALVAGCRNNDLVETELRTRERQYREALQELNKLEAHNNALQNEVAALRGGAHLPPEQAAPTFGLRRIVLGRGTGGYDNDQLPGDEALQVVIEPQDADGHTVKVPGVLHVSVLEITPQGLKKPLCWWQFGPEQLRTSWKQGLLSTGYTLLLPWTVFPATENVRVVAQMKLLDGRVFEADKDIRVRVVPGAPRVADPLQGPALMPGPVLPLETPVPTLPPPRDAGVVPSGSFTTSSFSPHPVPTESVRWIPAPLTGSVQIGRPEPVSAPPAPPDLPSLSELLK
jgi:hypothetical protein